MKSPVMTRESIKVDVPDEIMKFTRKVGTVLIPLIGVWAVTCLVAGVVSVGPLEMVKGYFTAITGF